MQTREPRLRAAAGRTCEAGGGDALLRDAQRVPKRRAELLHVRRRRRVHNRAEACGAAATVDGWNSFIETATVNLSSAPPPACRTLLKPAAATAMGAMSKHVSWPWKTFALPVPTLREGDGGRQQVHSAVSRFTKGFNSQQQPMRKHRVVQMLWDSGAPGRGCLRGMNRKGQHAEGACAAQLQ